MGLFSTPVEKAQRELERAEVRTREWIELVDQRRRDLVMAEADDGAEALAAHSDDVDAATALANASSRVAGLRAEVETAERAVAAARAECATAQLAVWAGQAVVLRDEAAEKRREATQRAPLTERLLAELLEHEGFVFGPLPLHHDLGDSRGFVPRTRTEQLRLDADELDRQADELAAKRVATSGVVSGVGLAELLENVDALPLALVPPPAPAIRAWVDAAVARLRKPTTASAEAPIINPRSVFFECVFTSGQVDATKSTAQPMHVAQPA